MIQVTGPNFDAEQTIGGVAIVRVWRRPDLSRDEGARCAQLIAEQMRKLSSTARCCLFDLTRATTSWGPATNQAIGEMLAAWETARRPIYILPSEEAIQHLLLRELQRKHAPRFGTIVTNLETVAQLLGKPPRPG